MMNDPKKSDFVKVAMRPMNKAGLGTAAESVERRTRAEGNTSQQSTHRTQCRVRVSQALERVRRAARERKENRFTALLHHISVDLLRLSFYALKRQAAPGVDGVTWQDYEADLESNLASLHERVQRGTYRALPSRRKNIPKPDGRVRALGIAGSGASADNSLRSAAEALKGTLVSDGKRLEIRHFCFAACGSSIRQEVFAGPKSLDAPEPSKAPFRAGVKDLGNPDCYDA
jgi:hypothetical protein